MVIAAGAAIAYTIVILLVPIALLIVGMVRCTRRRYR